MQLLDTDLTQNEVKTDSELGSLFLKPNKLGATVEKEASTTFALCVEEPLRYFSVWGVPTGTHYEDYSSARTFQFTEFPSDDTILTVLGGDWERQKNNYWDANDSKNKGKERPYKPISKVMTWPIYSFDEQCIKIFALDLVSIRKQLLEYAAEEGYETLSDWNWKLTQKKELRGSSEFTSYTLIPKPQTPKHKAEVKKAYEQRIDDGFYLENLIVGGNPLEEMAD
jgi:hypothetical protein